MARPREHFINLTDSDRIRIDKTIRNKSTCKTILKRCQILRDLDREKATGLIYTQIAHSYAVCPSTISNIIKKYINNGIDDVLRYNISPNSAAALRKADGLLFFWRRSPVLNQKHRLAERLSPGF